MSVAAEQDNSQYWKRQNQVFDRAQRNQNLKTNGSNSPNEYYLSAPGLVSEKVKPQVHPRNQGLALDNNYNRSSPTDSTALSDDRLSISSS